MQVSVHLLLRNMHYELLYPRVDMYQSNFSHRTITDIPEIQTAGADCSIADDLSEDEAAEQETSTVSAQQSSTIQVGADSDVDDSDSGAESVS